MLPIRLGMVNADGPQDLFVYALTRKGRVETTNYRTVKLPADMDVPLYVKKDVRRVLPGAVRPSRSSARTCAPSSSSTPGTWAGATPAPPIRCRATSCASSASSGWARRPGGSAKRPDFVPPGGGGQDVFLTRLHVRYDGAHFPEDLVFQETGDRQNFQGRYVLRHPWTGESQCEQARVYRRELPKRREQEAQTLASLTGWDIADIRRRMNLKASSQAPDPKEDEPWWKKIWPDGR